MNKSIKTVEGSHVIIIPSDIKEHYKNEQNRLISFFRKQKKMKMMQHHLEKIKK
ncbi:MAG: hypothetical protein HFJ38_02160 [Bacilli bacterium]|nr:hypothetical protein [Bacilli bacterium]